MNMEHSRYYHSVLKHLEVTKIQNVEVNSFILYFKNRHTFVEQTRKACILFTIIVGDKKNNNNANSCGLSLIDASLRDSLNPTLSIIYSFSDALLIEDHGSLLCNTF